MFESPDDRSAYHAARRLVKVHGQPHTFLTLKSRLEKAPGVVVASVPRSMALTCQEELAAVGLATQISLQIAAQAETDEDPPPEKVPVGRSLFRFILDRPGTTAAMLLGLILISALFGIGRNDSGSALDASVGPISAEQFAVIAVASIVDISCENRSGVGFFVEDGIAVTSAHVVCPAVPSVDIRFSNGYRVQGRVIRVDNWLDLALIRTTEVSGIPLRLTDSSGLESGDSVVMVGASNGVGSILARPRITDANRNLLGTTFLQIDTGDTVGDSGMPLLDASGRVVGIALSRVGSSANLWLVLPSNYLVEGPNTMMPDVEMAIDRDRWDARVREAGQADRAAAKEARSGTSGAGVLAARASSPTSVTVAVARWAASTPSDQLFSFTIRRGENILCSPSGTATRWLPASSGGGNIPSSKYVMWLERNDMLRDTFVSFVPLDTSGCDDPSAVAGATLVLHNGAPSADRSTIVSR